MPKLKLVIWCEPELKRRFKIFAAKNDMTYAQALQLLLDLYEKRVSVQRFV